MKPISYGMVGGGEGAFIADVHRRAIALNGGCELTAGLFSRDVEKSRSWAAHLGIEPSRAYASYSEMAQLERQRDDGIRFVVVVTPNASHYAICKAFLQKGIHVVCDKPLTVHSEEAAELAYLSEQSGALLCVTYTNTGYAAVRQMRDMVAQGLVGTIRFVNAEYAQQGMAVRPDALGRWRADPDQSGPSHCVGDIGTHIENLVATITGLRIERLSACLDSFIDGHRLDDNATVMVEYEGGAKGVYWASKIAIGSSNALAIRIYGSAGSLAWQQERPDTIIYTPCGKASQIIDRGSNPYLDVPSRYSRLPAGHPEGIYEAFANIYRSFLATLAGKAEPFPTAIEGLDGVRFIEACLASSGKDGAWVAL